MKKDNLIKELCNAVDALLLTLDEFTKSLSSDMSNQSELLKNYYLFATKILSHIQTMDSISLTIGEDIQAADKQNDSTEVQQLGNTFEATLEMRKLCEEFLSNSEQDIEAKQLELPRLKSYVEIFLRKILICKSDLTKFT